MTTALSSGFQEDCHAFMERFTALNSISFLDFTTVWNDMNFHCIFYGRQSIDDLNAFVEQALIIVKRIFIRNTNMVEKCCCFYLLYSIYQKQPDKFVGKIRVTESDWVAFKDFYEKLTSEEYQHPFIIWWKLLQDDAYHFCLFESNLLEGQSKLVKAEGSEPQLQFKPISGLILHELDNLQTNHGIMSALEALEIAYNEMKEGLDQTNASLEPGEVMTERTLVPSTFVKDINECLVEMQDLFTHLKPKRVKRRSTRKKVDVAKVRESDEEFLEDTGEGSIKDKRKLIKDRAFKEIKKKKGSVTDSQREQPSCSSQESPLKQKQRPFVDQKHFKKITEVQKIFEMNSLFKEEKDLLDSSVSSTPSPKRKKPSSKQ